jgi:hypothetical protein
MNPVAMIQEISEKDFDVDKFVELAIGDEVLRDELVLQMMTHPKIMVYYHCYYVVSSASEQRPDLFYQYWDEIASLLKHKNSYHRNFGLCIIGNLTQVDQANMFSGIFHGYFERINDERFMTGESCIRNSIKIIRNKPEFKDQILAILMDLDNRCDYTEKQKELLKSIVLEVIDEIYDEIPDRGQMNDFIKKGVSSKSPKTRRKAKQLVAKYGLSNVHAGKVVKGY